MVLDFFGRNGLFSAFILLGIVGISAQQSGVLPQVKQSSPPRIVKPVGEEEVKLLCNVKDAQNYTWYKNGKIILQPSARYTVKSYRFLRITDRVQKSDSGVFVCVATNIHGSANCTVKLIVEDPTVSPTNITGEKPQFLYPTRMESIKSTYKEGDKFTLTCEARGIPAPVVTWYKNDQIFHGRHRAGESIKTGVYDYIINFVGVDMKDEGNYTCIVSNMYGRLTYSFNFNVIEKVQRVPQIVIIWEQEEPVYAGSNLELFCIALSKDPNTRYRWYYRDSDVSEVGKLGTLLNQSLYELTSYQNDGFWSKWRLTLQLKNASVADSGLYACQAENVRGNESRQTYLNVTIRPITPSATDKQKRNLSQKHENATDGMSTVSPHKDEMPGEMSAWTNRIKHPDTLIGMLAGLIVLAIIAAGVFYWQVKKARASSSTAKSHRPEIDSLRAKYEVQNEYVVVPDYNRSV